MTYRIGSLFAGIGGFDLAAESLGWSTAWVSEIDPFASAVLAHHFPDAPNLGDITLIDWSTVERPDIICGGFPCQPHSLAGKRQASADTRDLWSECIRCLRELRPRYAVFENVRGLLTSESGTFFNRVLRDLAESGYDAEWRVLSASECGAPHQRSRIFIVAYPTDERLRECERQPTEGQASATGGRQVLGLPDWSDAIPYRGADGTVRLIPRQAVEYAGRGRCAPVLNAGSSSSAPSGREDDDEPRGGDVQRPDEAALAGIEPSLRTLADGVPDRLAGRDRGGEVEAPSLWPVTESEPGRVARLRAIGNAVVPLWVVRGPFARVMELNAALAPNTEGE